MNIIIQKFSSKKKIVIIIVASFKSLILFDKNYELQFASSDKIFE